MKLLLPKNLAPEWERPILERANRILEKFDFTKDNCDEWFVAISKIGEKKENLFLVWLAITGCYPKKSELSEFVSDLQVNGLRSASIRLISQRLKKNQSRLFLYRVVLVEAKYENLVDLTHTLASPYLTGIQRVAFGITNKVENISIFIWNGDTGIISEVPNIQASSDRLFFTRDRSWQKNYIIFLHKLLPYLEKSPIGKSIRTLILPFARKIKHYLTNSDTAHFLSSENSFTIENLLIMKTRLTVPEIPFPQNVYRYESIIENSITPVQIILYDFIPFFHAWTVHPKNRGDLNVYIRLVLLADKIFSISELVHEQAKLISCAFRLERTEWQNRVQDYSWLALPSGLKAAVPNEFEKDPKLVVMAGSLEPRKNHLQFLNALEIMAERNIEIRAEILGSAGWENDYILDRIHHLQAQGVNIVRIGNLTDTEMRERIAQSQALLQISEAEGFGLPVIEALGLGTRVIVSDVSPLREWESERVSVVKLGDSEELARALTNILKNSEVMTGPIYVDVTWKDWANLLYGKK